MTMTNGYGGWMPTTWEVAKIDGKDSLVFNTQIFIPSLFESNKGFVIGTISGDSIASAIMPEDDVPDPLRCPHCTRDWHPRALTLRVSQMLNDHRFDPDYDPDTDDSPVVCIGAEFQGPTLDVAGSPYWASGSPPWVTIVGGGQPSPMETAQKKIDQIVESLTLLEPQ